MTNKFSRRLHKLKQTPRKFLPIGTETTTERQATHSHVRCYLHCCWIFNQDRGRPEPKATVQTQNIRTYSVWIQNVQCNTDQNVNLCKIISLYIFRICRIWTPHVGKYLSGNRVHRQLLGNPFFSNKNESSSTLERLQLCITIQFCYRPRCWFHEHSGTFFVQNRSRFKEKLEMTIRNDIHTKAIEVNIQSTGIVEEEHIYILPDDEINKNQL